MLDADRLQPPSRAQRFNTVKTRPGTELKNAIIEESNGLVESVSIDQLPSASGDQRRRRARHNHQDSNSQMLTERKDNDDIDDEIGSIKDNFSQSQHQTFGNSE